MMTGLEDRGSRRPSSDCIAGGSGSGSGGGVPSGSVHILKSLLHVCNDFTFFHE